MSSADYDLLSRYTYGDSSTSRGASSGYTSSRYLDSNELINTSSRLEDEDFLSRYALTDRDYSSPSSRQAGADSVTAASRLVGDSYGRDASGRRGGVSEGHLSGYSLMDSSSTRYGSSRDTPSSSTTRVSSRYNDSLSRYSSSQDPSTDYGDSRYGYARDASSSRTSYRDGGYGYSSRDYSSSNRESLPSRKSHSSIRRYYYG